MLRDGDPIGERLGLAGRSLELVNEQLERIREDPASEGSARHLAIAAEIFSAALAAMLAHVADAADGGKPLLDRLERMAALAYSVKTMLPGEAIETLGAVKGLVVAELDERAREQGIELDTGAELHDLLKSWKPWNVDTDAACYFTLAPSAAWAAVATCKALQVRDDQRLTVTDAEDETDVHGFQAVYDAPGSYELLDDDGAAVDLDDTWPPWKGWRDGEDDAGAM